MGVHGIVDDLNKLQMGELPEEELRALEADLTGKVLTLSYFYDAQAAEKKTKTLTVTAPSLRRRRIMIWWR